MTLAIFVAIVVVTAVGITVIDVIIMVVGELLIWLHL